MRKIGELRKQNSKINLYFKDGLYYTRRGHYGHAVDLACGTSFSYADVHGPFKLIGGIDALELELQRRAVMGWRVGCTVKYNGGHQFRELREGA